MQLELEVTSFQRSSLGADAVKVFDGLGGSIGRARTNDWVLPDPERFVSSHHAVISYRNGSYFLTDKSTNGVFVNESDDPVGNGSSVKISDGDVIQIGQYSVVARLAEDQYGAEPPQPKAAEDDSLLGGGFGASYPDNGGSSPLGAADADVRPAAQPTAWGEPDWLKSGDTSDGQSPFYRDVAPMDGPDQGDIHAAEEKVRPTDAGWLPDVKEEEEWGAESDHLAADRQQMDLPSAIPEDWDMTGINLPKLGGAQRPAMPIVPPTPETAPPPPPPKTPAQPPKQPRTQPQVPPQPQTPTQATQSPLAPPPHQPATQPTLRAEPPLQPPPQPAVAPTPAPTPGTDVDSATALKAFFQGAGIQPQELPAESPEAYMRFLGQMFREITDGVMQVMRARTDVKSSFRMQQTVIGSSQNNPLKFMISADEAFDSMFGNRRKGYLPPDEAFRASFEDIKSHEMALIAGMRAAFDGLLREFDPQTLEKSFDQQKSGRGFLSGKKQKWELYQEFYKEIVARAQDDFQGIFGAEFVRAYEEQIEALLRNPNRQ